MADLIKKLGENVLILSHVKEILEQNVKTIENHTGKKVSIYSASLNRKEIGDITMAGIQSAYNHPELFKHFKWVIIDEAHTVNPEAGTMYSTFFAAIDNHVRIAVTATPFRLGAGFIYSDDDLTLFDKVTVDYCTREKFNQLVEEGFLSRLTTKRTELEMDTSGIKLLGGDFSEKQLSERFDRDGVTNKAIKEIIAAGANRKKWLIFAIDINHAEHIAEVLIRNGISTAPVHSKMKESGFCRDKTLENFKDGKYKCVVNVNVLTTGFDAPDIDLIAMLRPTSSPVLHVQTLGRGSRVHPGKDDCLVLDFAGNTARLGPINDVLIKKVRKGEGGGEPITKTCPKCNSILPPALKICPDCGHKFKFEHHLSANAANVQIMDDGKAHWLPVTGVVYEPNIKIGSPSSIKVTYDCCGRKVNEYVCIMHKGFAKHKADHWVKYRGGEACDSIEAFMDQILKLSKPKEILVQKKNKYYIINNSKF
jgi:DNA repair protein RadD